MIKATTKPLADACTDMPSPTDLLVTINGLEQIGPDTFVLKDVPLQPSIDSIMVKQFMLDNFPHIDERDLEIGIDEMIHTIYTQSLARVLAGRM